MKQLRLLALSIAAAAWCTSVAFAGGDCKTTSAAAGSCGAKSATAAAAAKGACPATASCPAGSAQCRAAGATTAAAMPGCTMGKSATAASMSGCAMGKSATATAAAKCPMTPEQCKQVQAAAASAKGKGCCNAETASGCTMHGASAAAAGKCDVHSTAAAAHANCAVCSDEMACDDDVKATGARSQVVALRNGAMIVYTVDDVQNVRALQAAVARHNETVVAALQGDAGLCGECKRLRGALASGKLVREVVNVERGCQLLITSSDRSIVRQVHDYTGAQVAARTKS